MQRLGGLTEPAEEQSWPSAFLCPRGWELQSWGRVGDGAWKTIEGRLQDHILGPLLSVILQLPGGGEGDYLA